MDLKILSERIIGSLLFLFGALSVYIFVAVLPATSCTEVWEDGKLIRNTCQPVYYDIASYTVSGETIGWAVLILGIILLSIGVWTIWRTTGSSSSETTP